MGEGTVEGLWCRVVFALAAGAVCSCGSQVSICTPGKQSACDCPGATQSVQVCGDDEAFGPCQCDDVITTGGGAGLPEGSSLLSDGSQPLLELFDGGGVLYVVLRDEVKAIDQSGEVVATWSSGFDLSLIHI